MDDTSHRSEVSPSDAAVNAPTKTHENRDVRSDGGSGRLEVRCPNCHASMEVAVDTPLTDLTCPSCGSHFSLVDQSQATRMAPPLSKLGRFELIERLGVGGFGSVWKARDNELDRTVAIKIPRAGGMTPEDQEKFFREARAAAQLRHPSIVSVHEVGRDGDSVYIVSDFVRGVTLGDWLTGQRLTSREAAELCAKIADALHHAHEQGVVHRDLKPANIMIDGDGQPHLMDFGLARREVGEVTVTVDGQVLGTPAYMSPEQAQGEAHTADRRSDVYSLGVILFQLLTGELPFRGNARMLIHQVVHDEPPSPRKLNGNIPKDLETIALKCMQKEPVRRYQSAQDLANELGRFLSGDPIHARPTGRLERGWRWSKRNRVAAAFGLVTVACLIVGTATSTFFAVSERRARQATEDMSYRLGVQAAGLQIANDNLSAADVLLSQVERNSGLWEWRHLRLATRPSVPMIDGEYRPVWDIAVDEKRNRLLAFCGGGKLLAFDDISSEPRLLLDAFPEEPKIFPGSGVRHGRMIVDQAADSVFLAFDNYEYVVRYPLGKGGKPNNIGLRAKLSSIELTTSVLSAVDVDTGKPVSSLSLNVVPWLPPAHGVQQLAEGEVLVIAGRDDGMIRLTDDYTHESSQQDLAPPVEAAPQPQRNVFQWVGDLLAQGKTVKTAPQPQLKAFRSSSSREMQASSYSIRNVAVSKYSPTNSSQLFVFAAAGDDRIVRSWQETFGSERQRLDHPLELRTHVDKIWALALSSDGRLIASGDESGRICWTPTMQTWTNCRESYFNGVQAVTAVAISPDSKRIAWASQQGFALVENIETGLPEWLFPHEAIRYAGVEFSGDGSRLVVTGGDRTRVWDLATGLVTRAIAAGGRAADVSQSNGLLAFSGIGGQIHVERLHDGTAVAQFFAHDGVIWGCRFNPSGNLIVTAGQDKVAKVWRSTTGELVTEFRGHSDEVNWASFTPDGRHVVSCSEDDTIKVWEADTGREIQTYSQTEDQQWMHALSPDGNRLASIGEDGFLNIWDTRSGSMLLRTVAHEGNGYAVKFSPCGRYFVTSGQDGRVKIWLGHALDKKTDMALRWARAALLQYPARSQQKDALRLTQLLPKESLETFRHLVTAGALDDRTLSRLEEIAYRFNIYMGPIQKLLLTGGHRDSAAEEYSDEMINSIRAFGDSGVLLMNLRAKRSTDKTN